MIDHSENRPFTHISLYSLEHSVDWPTFGRPPFIHGARMPPIAVLQGGTNHLIQNLMRSCARRWAQEGAKVAGVVECFSPGLSRARDRVRLLDLQTDERYAIFQDLGPLAASCHFDSGGVVAACERARRGILLGCDVAIISKFGQLEAKRSGLIDAFVAAVETNTPILTAVSPIYASAWAEFSASFGTLLLPCDQLLETWWADAQAAR